MSICVMQAIADEIDAWSVRNETQLNVDKTKELIVSFSGKHPPDDIPLVIIADKELERITCAKVLGVYISGDLSWWSHIDYICPNASKRLYFLSMLKRAGASQWGSAHVLQSHCVICRRKCMWCGTLA